MYHNPNTPFKTFYKDIKEYTLKKDDNYLTFLIRKTSDSILINSNYYEIKLNKDELSGLTNINFRNIDEAFNFLNNLFNQDCVKIKAIASDTIGLELRINNFQNKRVDLCLSENLDNQYYLFKDLYQKQMNLSKELNFLKEDNFKLRQENMNIKNEFMLLKNNFINEMDQIKNKISDLINKITFINQKNFSIEQLIKKGQQNIINYNQDQFKKMQQEMKFQNQRIEELDYLLRGKSISVLFKNPMGYTFPVNCYQKDLCSEMIKKYKNKDKDFCNDNTLSFLFNGKNLELNLSLSEYGITNGSQIVVIN